MMGRYGPAAADPAVVTAADMVAGHVTLDVSCPQFSFTKEQRRVSVFYVCIWDNKMGSGFIKICTYFPYPVKARINGQLRSPGGTGAPCGSGSRHGNRQAAGNLNSII